MSSRRSWRIFGPKISASSSSLATIAARLLLVAGGFVGAGSCIPACTPSAAPGTPEQAPAQTTPEPEVLVGIRTRVSSVAVGGGAAVVVTEPDGSVVAQVPAGEVWRIVPSRSGLGLGPAKG